jgi:hypothetical protein
MLKTAKNSGNSEETAKILAVSFRLPIVADPGFLPRARGVAG